MQPINANGYNIYFNNDCYSYVQEALANGGYTGIFVLADTNTSQYCLPNFLAQLATELPVEIIEIEAGEANKSIETCIEVWHALTDLGAERKSLLINIGGGVVTDLGGFVASTFKRGVDFINVPTSLLAMVDASVGGKTGVDLGVLKNQVGVINNPAAVLIDTNFLDTLPQAEMRSGLAEMLKHGLIADKTYWDSFSDLSNMTTDDLGTLIHWSVEIKNRIVELDPNEKNIRKVLNFGHTLGHAIESHFLSSPAPLLHGEAIAAGMVMESYLSMSKGLLLEEEYESVKSVVHSIFGIVNFETKDIESIISLMAHDKKNESGRVMFVLLNGIGNAAIDHKAGNALIIKAFEDYQK
ncbi:3-dehydroquinate synthase [Flavobacterium sp. MFBS3-15]|uniref:3-dehydroquinate synthase n=1 Tax=Flavobacterium sp. MFBS3-15 TaxID=2989816 RepID=UPI0022364B8B|nr:3-dehydroquinate synthase [Flavobacterium sp. MFBS3-15]MCW4470812.1 3-dehydroquinate synthase [Flavobacterium sp. MFBS3-15]